MTCILRTEGHGTYGAQYIRLVLIFVTRNDTVGSLDVNFVSFCNSEMVLNWCAGFTSLEMWSSCGVFFFNTVMNLRVIEKQGISLL